MSCLDGLAACTRLEAAHLLMRRSAVPSNASAANTGKRNAKRAEEENGDGSAEEALDSWWSGEAVMVEGSRVRANRLERARGRVDHPWRAKRRTFRRRMIRIS